MIFKEILNIGSNEIELTTQSQLSKKTISEIQFLIDFFSKELNHNIKESSAWKFNNGQIRIPIYVKPEFIQYFKFVYKIFSNHPDTFEPFSISFFKIDYVSFDNNSEYIIKNTDFKFDTSFFRLNFIVQYIAEYLKEKKFDTFLIQWDEKYIAFGNYDWEVLPGGHKYILNNSSAIFFHYSPSGFESHKFGAIQNELSESDALVLGQDLSELKVLTPQINYLNTKTDLSKFSYENNIKVVFLD